MVEDKQKKFFEVFSLDKAEFLKKCGKDFHIWDDDADEKIAHYSFSFSEKEQVAGYEIAQKSVDEYGIEAICAAIAHEMQVFNFGEETDKKEQFFEDIKESIRKIDSGEEKCVPADEALKELKASFRKKCTPEQNEYFDAQDEFEEKIKHLKDAWWEQEMKNKHQVLIDFIKEEHNKY